jgi:hypothetical protein
MTGQDGKTPGRGKTGDGKTGDKKPGTGGTFPGLFTPVSQKKNR